MSEEHEEDEQEDAGWEEAKEDEETEEKVELQDISLEEITEEPEEPITGEDFSEFMLGPASEMPTATLTPTPSDELALPTETLEEEAAEAPALPAIPEVEEPEEQYMTVYNEPSYSAPGMSEENILVERREREEMGMMGTPEELRHAQRRIKVDDWQEGGQSIEQGRTGGGHLREYVVSEDVERREERRLPFEEKTKYRAAKR